MRVFLISWFIWKLDYDIAWKHACLRNMISQWLTHKIKMYSAMKFGRVIKMLCIFEWEICLVNWSSKSQWFNHTHHFKGLHSPVLWNLAISCACTNWTISLLMISCLYENTFHLQCICQFKYGVKHYNKKKKLNSYHQCTGAIFHFM